MSMTKLRRVWFQVHLWLAVSLCLLLVPLGLTGVVLAWPQQFNAWSNPPPRASGQATLAPSAYFDAAKAALPEGARLGILTLPAHDGQPVSVATQLRRGPPGERRQPARVVFLEPATAKVIAVRAPGSPVFSFSHEFHENLMIRGWGRQAVGVLGVVMLILSLTGIWLWWPRGAFAKGFAWRRAPGTMMNLHYLTGFWISVPLAIVSVTGIFLSFPGLLGGEAEPPRTSPAAAPRSAPPLSADEAAAQAVAFAPGSSLASLAQPTGAGPWRASVIDAGHKRDLDVTSNGVVKPAAPRGAGADAALTNRLVHLGGYNRVWKWLVTLTGLLPLLLAITGVYTWGKLELRKARMRRQQAT